MDAGLNRRRSRRGALPLLGTFVLAALAILPLFLTRRPAAGGEVHDVEFLAIDGAASTAGNVQQPYTLRMRNNSPVEEDIGVGFRASSDYVDGSNIDVALGDAPSGTTVVFGPFVTDGVIMALSVPVPAGQEADVDLLVTFPNGFTTGNIEGDICHAGDAADQEGRGFQTGDSQFPCFIADDGFVDANPANDLPLLLEVAEEQPASSMTICKDTNPANSGKSFDFNSDVPGMTGFSLEDGGCENAAALDAGTYTITESETEGWALADISCQGTSQGNVDVNLGAGSVGVGLQAGEDVECTFVNDEVEPTDTPVPQATPTHTLIPATDTPEVTGTVTPPAPTITPGATDQSTPSSTMTPTPTTTNTARPVATNTPFVTATPEFQMGDVNKDGWVSQVDALLILQHEAYPREQVLTSPANADVNLDGVINSIDATLIAQFVARLIPELPA